MKILEHGKPEKYTDYEPKIWFAWYPIWAWNKYGGLSYVWLEKVSKKRNPPNYLCKYRYEVIY